MRLPALFTNAYLACLSVEIVLAEEGARLRTPILPALALLVAVGIGAWPGLGGERLRG